MPRIDRRFVSYSRTRHTALALAFTSLVLGGFANSAPAQPSPFDGLHCHRVRDAWRHEAALQLLARDGELPERCELTGRAVLACVPARVITRGDDEDAARAAPDPDASLVFDRLCYRVRCEAGTTSLVCLPGALGDLEELMLRSDPSTAQRARARAAGVSENVQLAMCGDFTMDGAITATDALGILRTAIGADMCLPCVCDVDNSESFTATDALIALRIAVGAGGSLECQADGTPVFWEADGDGFSWHDPPNWSLETRIPNACEDVMIVSGVNVTVQHSAGSSGALRVKSVFPLVISGGSLAIRDTLQVDADLTFRGGTLAGATVLPSAVSTAVRESATLASTVTFTSSAGTLDAVTMNRPMDLLTTSSRIDIANGLVLNETAPIVVSRRVSSLG